MSKIGFEPEEQSALLKGGLRVAKAVHSLGGSVDEALDLVDDIKLDVIQDLRKALL